MSLLHLLKAVRGKLEPQEKILEVEGVSKVELLPRKAAGHSRHGPGRKSHGLQPARMRDLAPPPAGRLGTVGLNVSPAGVCSCLAISFLSMSP